MAQAGRLLINPKSNPSDIIIAGFEENASEISQTPVRTSCCGLNIPVSAGKVYAIAVDVGAYLFETNSFRPVAAEHIDFDLDVISRPAPENDDFNNATLLEGSDIAILVDIDGATLEPLENPAPSTSGTSVWYQWTPQTNGWLQISTGAPPVFSSITSRTNEPPWLDVGESWLIGPLLNENYWLPPGYAGSGGAFGVGSTVTRDIGWVSVQPVFTIYRGAALGSLLTLNSGPAVQLAVTAGETYYISVNALGYPGTVPMHLRFTPGPYNDRFTSAVSLDGYSATAQGHTAGATLSAEEQFGSPHFNTAPVVWWNWTAPDEGPVEASLFCPGYAPRLVALVGETATNLSLVAIPKSEDLGGYLKFYAYPGRRYHLAVTTWEIADSRRSTTPAAASYQLSLTHLPAKLRPVTAGGGGLLISGPSGRSALVQQVFYGSWYSTSLFTGAETTGQDGVVGTWFPWPEATSPNMSGLFRVWLLDFPLPPPRIVRIETFVQPQGVHSLLISRQTMDPAIVERSTDLQNWAFYQEIPGNATVDVRGTNSVSPTGFYRVIPTPPRQMMPVIIP